MAVENNSSQNPELSGSAETGNSSLVGKTREELIRLGVVADIECDQEEAKRLWEEAAEMGSPKAYYHLASLAQEEQDSEDLAELDKGGEYKQTTSGKAMELYKKAAEMGSPEAKKVLEFLS